MKAQSAISIVIAVLLSVFGNRAAAGEYYLGTYNSLKGIGASAAFRSGDSGTMNIINLYADMFGVFSGRTRDVGVAVSFSRDYVLAYADFDYAYLSIHAGPGCLTGYVRDFERHFFSSEGKPYKNMGLVAALTGNIGLSADFFSHSVSIDVSFSVNPGVHIRRDKDNGALLLSLYKRGLYYCLIPQVCIYYRF